MKQLHKAAMAFHSKRSISVSASLPIRRQNVNNFFLIILEYTSKSSQQKKKEIS